MAVMPTKMKAVGSKAWSYVRGIRLIIVLKPANVPL